MAIRKKTGGRVAGTPNRTTAETKEILQKVVGKELDKLGKIIEQLEPIERINAISKLLPYILPKQSENTLKGDKDNPIVISSPEERERRIEQLKSKLDGQ